MELLEHAAIVLLIFFIINAGSMLILSVAHLRNHKFSKYFIALLWSCTGILLFVAYLLAFTGKQYTNQVYTVAMVFGYIRNLPVFVQSLSVEYSLILLLLLIPIGIVGWHMWFARAIFDGLVSLQEMFIAKRTTSFFIAMAFLLFGTGFCSGTLVFNHEHIVYRAYQDEEPIISAFWEKPLHKNMYFANRLENPKIRAQYPKNIHFEKLNVVIIVVDALRADHLSLYGYRRNTTPFINRLFSDGNLRKVEQTFASSSGSFASILTILRGRNWPDMGRNDFALQDLLKDQGYRINFLISGNHRAFFNLKSFYGRSIDFYFDGSDSKDYVVNDDRLILEAFRKVPATKDEPSFFYIHLNSAHVAGYRLSEYRVFRPYQHYWAVPAFYINNYDNGILQADHYISKIFQLLNEKGYLQKSIVIITADHGESLGERGYYSHAHHLYTDEILVPMLIYDSNQTVSYKGLKLATHIDVAPTIVDRLGLPVPESWSGNSLLKQEKNPYSLHYSGPWKALIHHDADHLYKYIYNTRTAQEEAYDLNADLYESHNTIGSINPGYLKQLRSIITR